MTIVYQTEAYGYTPEKIAHEFARRFFDVPREIQHIESDGRFQLVDGNATYKVMLSKGEIDTFQVVRI